MEVHIVSRKLITPSSQNHHPNNIKLSFFDQLAEPVYFKFIIYYEHTNKDTIPRLEKSLSEALTTFYPFAGRYVEEEFSVECNGHGVEFLVAQVRNGFVSRLLHDQEPDPELLSGFVPCLSDHSSTAPLVSVQANVFECGGLALGFAVSHLLCDAYTFTLFLTAWASECRPSNSLHETPTITNNPPNFNLASIFPPRDHKKTPISSKPATDKPPSPIPTTRRFVFDARAISTLKSKCKSISTVAPSRVQAVTALIWRALITSKNPESPSRASLAAHSLNLRAQKKTPTPQKNPNCGNFCGKALAWFLPRHHDESVELSELAGAAGEAVRAVAEEQSLSGSEESMMLSVERVWREMGEAVESESVDVYFFTSWCRMGHYEVDFGWGGPNWVSSLSAPVNGLIVLMDTKNGDGVEAWVTLDESKMALFEQDRLLLSFTSNKYYH